MPLRVSVERTPLLESATSVIYTPMPGSRIGRRSRSAVEDCSPHTPHPTTPPATPISDHVSQEDHRDPPSPPITPWNRLSPRLTLENTGSVARDHLASERTFLAYVRTSLAVASAGVGVYFASISFLPAITHITAAVLVQLFTISVDISPSNGPPHPVSIQKFARPLGATCVSLGMIVLIVGELSSFFIFHK
jgi:uncharacterized membrane protein YidH (DUF202 family)